MSLDDHDKGPVCGINVVDKEHISRMDGFGKLAQEPRLRPPLADSSDSMTLLSFVVFAESQIDYKE